MMTFVCYPKCSTCRKAEEWLKKNGIEYTVRDIKTDRPSEGEISRWQELSGLPLKRFFNTSGQLYRQLGVRERLETMDRAEQLKLLGSDDPRERGYDPRRVPRSGVGRKTARIIE